MKCPNCREQVNIAATRCVHCRSRIPVFHFFKQIIKGFVIGAILLGCMAVVSSDFRLIKAIPGFAILSLSLAAFLYLKELLDG